MDTFVNYNTADLAVGQNQDTPEYKVAIIGFGPKGLYAFERLTAELKQTPTKRKVEVHIFNRTPNFGSGEIWNPAQPEYLMVNFSIGNIDMWIEDEAETLADFPVSLTDWLNGRGESVTETDFVSRGVVGEYLEDGFRQIIRNLPDNITVEIHIGEVCDIEKTGEDFEISFKKNDRIKKLKTRFQNIILTTGHTSRHRDDREKSYSEFSQKYPKTSFVPFVYPVERLDKVPADSTVAIKGMGLTFVDAVLALTEGRNGQFVKNEKGEIVDYKPSGKEPKAIYPFSRSGLPILTRGAHFGEADFKLHFFTEENIEKLRRNSADRKLDFANLWELVQKEMIFAYYRVLMRNSGFDFEMPENFRDFQAEIERFHASFPDEERFNLNEFFDPLEKEEYAPVSHRIFIENHIEQAIKEARFGENSSPFAAVVAVWREITPVFGKLYEFGGLTPESHKDFLENYFGRLCQITFGPPIESMEKILAIARAGILKFEIGAEPEVLLDEAAGKFFIRSNQNKFECRAEHLIDARIPKNKIPENASVLYKNLLKRGLIRLFENGDFLVGCLGLDRNGFVIDANGRAQMNFAAYGTPTEGITFDNDSLTRSRNNFASIWARSVAKDVLRGKISA